MCRAAHRLPRRPGNGGGDSVPPRVPPDTAVTLPCPDGTGRSCWTPCPQSTESPEARAALLRQHAAEEIAGEHWFPVAGIVLGPEAHPHLGGLRPGDLHRVPHARSCLPDSVVRDRNVEPLRHRTELSRFCLSLFPNIVELCTLFIVFPTDLREHSPRVGASATGIFGAWRSGPGSLLPPPRGLGSGSLSSSSSSSG